MSGIDLTNGTKQDAISDSIMDTVTEAAMDCEKNSGDQIKVQRNFFIGDWRFLDICALFSCEDHLRSIALDDGAQTTNPLPTRARFPLSFRILLGRLRDRRFVVGLGILGLVRGGLGWRRIVVRFGNHNADGRRRRGRFRSRLKHLFAISRLRN